MTRSELKQLQQRYQTICKQIKQGTALSLFDESPKQQEQRIQHLLKPANYNDCFLYYFGGDSHLSLADSPCADFHIQATKELITKPIINQFRLWFRGSAKSVHTNIGNMFVLKQLQLSQFSVLVGANELRAKMLLADIQAHLQYNEKIIKDFGIQMSYGDWKEASFQTMDNCFFVALGIEQPFRGLRKYGTRIQFATIDDVEDRKVANNARIVNERVEKIMGDLAFAMSKDKRRMVFCNNLMTKQGVIQRLINKIGDKRHSSISVVNITDNTGKATWHQRYSKQDIANLKDNTDYYSWQREMMNNPIEEGKVFKEQWIQYRKVPSLNTMNAIVAYGDLSYKTDGDYKAIILLGKKAKDFFVIDCLVQQTTRQIAAKWLYDTYEKRNLELYPVSYYFEGSFAQDEFIIDFDFEGTTRGYDIPILADTAPKINKYDRIESMTGWFERGNIYFNAYIQKTSHCKNLITQLLAFEKGGKAHDDGPDALQSAIAKANRVNHRAFENIVTSPYAHFRKRTF